MKIDVFYLRVICTCDQGRTQGGFGLPPPPCAWYFTKTLLF